MREKNELAGIDHEAPRQRDFHSSSRLGYPRLISLGGAMNLTLMVQARHGELSGHAQMVTCHGCIGNVTPAQSNKPFNPKALFGSLRS